MVYFVQSGDTGPIKIGYVEAGRSMESRLRSLQVGNPEQLHLLAALPEGGRQTEQWLHRALASARVRGEWFRVTPLLEKVLNAVLYEPDALAHLIENATAVPKPTPGRPTKGSERTRRRVAMQHRLQEQIDSGEVKISYK